MGYLIKSITMVGVVTGLWVGLFAQNGQGLAAASTQHGLSQEAQTFANDCQNALHTYGHDFAPQMSVSQGCDCLAGQLEQTNGADFGAARVILVGLISYPAGPSASEPDWATIALDAGITDLMLGHLLQASHAAMGQCIKA
jgi:hypothetical protein